MPPIAAYDRVELTAPVARVPAGAAGGVLEVRDDGTAMLEITSKPELSALDRVVFAPLTVLRRLN